MDKFWQNNWVMKAIAVLIACMLWMIVNINQQPGTVLSNQNDDQLTIDNIQVEPIYDEELYVIVEMEQRAQVLLSGRRALLNLNMLRQDQYRVFADLTELGEGEHIVQLQHDGFPAELDVTIIPQRVSVVLAEKEFKTFPIEIELTGSLPNGYTIEGTEVTPEQVQVIAPQSILENVSMVRAYVNLNNARESFQEEVSLRVYDDNGNEQRVEISPAQVVVDVNIVSPSVEVPFNLQMVNEPPDGFSLIEARPSASSVMIYGPEDAIRSIPSLQMEIDLADFGENETISYEVPVSDNWHRVEPEVINIDIRIGPREDRVFSSVPLVILEPSPQYSYSIQGVSNNRLSITLFGSVARLAELEAENIEIVLDLQDLSSGSHQVEAQISVPRSRFYSWEDVFLDVDVSVENIDADDDSSV